MAKVPVPRTLDALPRVLFFELDYFIVFMLPFALGTRSAAWWVGVLLGLVCVKWWSRARAGGGVARGYAMLYWAIPFDLLQRVPASSRRHFVG